jgi:four helix bundle protein
MTKSEMLQRTKAFALRVIKVVQALPREAVGGILGRQLLRAGTSVGANYRAACRAKSAADFVHKLKIVEEECDESMFWMELLVEAELVTEAKLGALMTEANELTAIVVASLRTARTAANRDRQISSASDFRQS